MTGSDSSMYDLDIMSSLTSHHENQQNQLYHITTTTINNNNTATTTSTNTTNHHHTETGNDDGSDKVMKDRSSRSDCTDDDGDADVVDVDEKEEVGEEQKQQIKHESPVGSIAMTNISNVDKTLLMNNCIQSIPGVQFHSYQFLQHIMVDMNGHHYQQEI
ncbi:unnamed protein product [Heterobilharzia americana]|nr:unnamed protein product [Heterobilharzia americana]